MTEITLYMSLGGTQETVVCQSYYLHKEDDEEIEVGYSPELLKKILGDEIPNGVLEEKDRAASRWKTERKLQEIMIQTHEEAVVWLAGCFNYKQNRQKLNWHENVNYVNLSLNTFFVPHRVSHHQTLMSWWLAHRVLASPVWHVDLSSGVRTCDRYRQSIWRWTKIGLLSKSPPSLASYWNIRFFLSGHLALNVRDFKSLLTQTRPVNDCIKPWIIDAPVGGRQPPL